MYSLNNSYMNVAVLDPISDQNRFGTRYCTGGYIFQIADHHWDELISGPTFPYAFNWFDGQGLPEAFANPLPDTTDASSTLMLEIGVGLFDKTDNSVKEFCKWDITETPQSLRFATQQNHSSWSLEMTRLITLVNRTLKSETFVKNTGQGKIPLRWYPHPFFPLYPGGECCKLNVPVTIPDNPGYELLANGFIHQKNLPWDQRGHFQVLEIPKGEKLQFLQKHPKLGLIAATCSYAAVWMPIWGNRYTFSFEPYFEYQLANGDEASWSITYDF